MSDKLRVAMLGMGNMGRTHVSELRKMPEVEIVSLCSMPVDDADLYNRQNGTSYPVFEDFDRMLDAVAMDALYVCLPPFAPRRPDRKGRRERNPHLCREALGAGCRAGSEHCGRREKGGRKVNDWLPHALWRGGRKAGATDR